MPNDVYRWEEGGGLVHHCPICKTPLSHEMCRSRCLGEHVEWCSRYHTQLFRKGWTGQCAPCKHSEAQHDERHREIAELLHQLKDLQQERPTELQLTTPKLKRTQISPAPITMPKKERKAVKKAAKLASLPKVITTGDIDFVAKTLHPDDHEGDEAEEERRLLEDPDIKLNLYYHKGTSNHKEVRHRHLKPKQRGGEAAAVDDDELDALLADLKVPKLSDAKSMEERRLIASIREAVHDDLANVAKEHEQTRMRKAGFWRWASKKVYTRLLQHGRLWDQTADTDMQKRKDSAYAGPDEEKVEDGTEEFAELTLGDDEQDTTAAESTVAAVASTPVAEKRKSDISRSATKPATTIENAWTQVGKKSRASTTPRMQLKMSGNGGLAKLMVKPKGMFGALGPNGVGYAEADGSE